MKIEYGTNQEPAILTCEPGDRIGLVDDHQNVVVDPQPMDETGQMTWEVDESGSYAWALFRENGTLLFVGNYEDLTPGNQYTFIEPSVRYKNPQLGAQHEFVVPGAEVDIEPKEQ
jgi:hypothetical protein